MTPAYKLTDFVIDDEGNMTLLVLATPRLAVEQTPLPSRKTRTELGIHNPRGFTGQLGEEPARASAKECRMFETKHRRTSAGNAVSVRNARERMLAQFEALGESRMRYGRKTLVSLDQTQRGKSKVQQHWQWRCDCGVTGYVPCSYWAQRHTRVGSECTACSRKSTQNKRNGGRPLGSRNGQ